MATPTGTATRPTPKLKVQGRVARARGFTLQLTGVCGGLALPLCRNTFVESLAGSPTASRGYAAMRKGTISVVSETIVFSTVKNRSVVPSMQAKYAKLALKISKPKYAAIEDMAFHRDMSVEDMLQEVLLVGLAALKSNAPKLDPFTTLDREGLEFEVNV